MKKDGLIVCGISIFFELMITSMADRGLISYDTALICISILVGSWLIAYTITKKK